jgi:WD40 repeat protein
MTVRVWSVATGKLIQSLTRQSQGKFGWQEHVVSLAFSKDGAELAAGGDDGVISIWEIGAGKHLTDLVGHTDQPYGLAFSPDKKTIVSSSGGSSDYSMRLWSVDNGVQIKNIDLGGIGYSATFSDDGLKVAASGWETLLVFQFPSMAKIAAFVNGNRHQATSVVAFSHAGEIVASGGDSGLIRGWDCLTGRLEFELAATVPTSPSDFPSRVKALAFSRDDGRLLSISQNGAVKLWNVKSRKLIAQAVVSQSDVEDLEPAVSASSDLKIIAVGSKQNKVLLWKVHTQ